MPRVIELLLVGLLGLALAKIAIAIFAPLPTPKGDVVGAAMSTQSSARERAPADAKNPFHSAAVSAGPIEDIPDVAETSLDLTLTGVWPKGDEGSAIIRRSDGKEKRHAVGETITTGVRLVAVYEDQVIIEQNGVRESLRFESKTPVKKRIEAAPQPERSFVTAQELSDAIKMSVTKDANGATAIALNAGRNAAVFERIGFQSGDILRSVNGTPAPADPSGLLTMMNKISRAEQTAIVIERNGQRMPITLSVKGNE
ncbi:type II secretion system protein N [Hyphococcus lacteus]|uniref:Type II secretion system protein N n=1 Tax=Hyphococcus lacteus TaxID=3143536 RepID=A0ABV3Z605_9PROT